MSDLLVAVVGNPNAGKTTLFNALTGLRQDVGNWPGVTVERKEGRFDQRGRRFVLVDLPGVYAVQADADGLSADERIARTELLDGKADVVLNVVDASNIERNLYLTTQLLELGRPVVVALTMVDVARSWDTVVDAGALSARLGCPVVPVVATRGEGVAALGDAMAEVADAHTAPTAIAHEPEVEAQVEALLAGGGAPDRATALRRVEAGHVPEATAAIIQALGAEPDIVLASGRYRFVGAATRAAVHRGASAARRRSDRIDRVVLHRWLGIPIFLACMYLLFMLTIGIGGAFVDFFDILAGHVLVDGTGTLLAGWGTPAWLITLLADGVGGGLTTVATFIPIIGCLFLILTCLEDSGYMARAAFVMDRFLRGIGLPGKAFVPMILGFGCTIPAVLATRTLDNARDRIVAVMMAPFMSCGARLPVYALFAAAFFPASGQNLVFALYLTGIGAAVLTGLLLRRTLLQGRSSPFVMELPPYRWPRPGAILRRTWERLWSFIDGAGRIIVAVVVVITFLNAWGTDGSFENEDSDRSVLAAIGQTLTPAFAPMGISQENWPATVGIFTGILAKEAVVGTLDALYTGLAEGHDGAELATFDLQAATGEALASVPANLGDVVAGWRDPLGLGVEPFDDLEAAAEANAVATGTFGAMQERFDGRVGAFAYLLLILLYAPCLAAMGAISREAGAGWGLFAALWTTGLGYGSAVVFYQVATFGRDPLAASLWIAGVAVVIALVMRSMIRAGEVRERSGSVARIAEGSA